MKNFQVMSDLHLEFYKDNGKELIKSFPVKSEILVLAGDITIFPKSFDTLKYFTDKYEHVIYVLGNHEYYKSSLESSQDYIDKLNSISNLHVLKRNTVKINDITFHGATLWFKESIDCFNLSYRFNDFNQIGDFYEWVYEENKKDVEFLSTIEKDSVVVTHHLPSYESVAEKYHNNKTNCFFVCNVEDIIVNNSPSFWVHGHTHSNVNYKINETNVICNPKGYFSSNHIENVHFRDDLLIECTA